MCAAIEETPPRPSRLIAESLIRRDGPRRIGTRAARLGFPPQLTCAMIAACGQTAIDPVAAQRRSSQNAQTRDSLGGL